ncbi:MAG: ribonuclease HI [Calditrichaeota bacterium]|nr:MAG: ribonuclease HI [Calditrichota bacterium]
MNQQITIYTDGSSLGNPGPGGFAFIMQWQNHQKEFSRGFYLTTNNRMELMAIIESMKQLKTQKYPVVIYTDSRYVADALNKGWLWKWEEKNFAKKQNPDLWKEFIGLYKKFDVTIEWIKGHNGHPSNERCDLLAKKAAENPQHHDTYFENIYKQKKNLFE